MPECELVHEPERRTTQNRQLATGLQRTTSSQFVELLAARRIRTDASGDVDMRKASTGMLEPGIQAPSPKTLYKNQEDDPMMIGFRSLKCFTVPAGSCV
jgi:hypothetical protein